ncbi:DUF4352 domain-containing protein [Streptomyces sp. NPDC002454]|uniref:DUF4352 domain-containing protein n=1 Tax=Streptomyces sp. NPDC002490 TaxID=3154416 RepID=UPI003321B283
MVYRSLSALGASTVLIALACTGCSAGTTDGAASPAAPRSPAAGAPGPLSGADARVSAGVSEQAGTFGVAYLGDGRRFNAPGSAEGEDEEPQYQLTVTPKSVVVGALPAKGGGTGPAAGQHWEAVKVSLANTGWDTYEGILARSLTVQDSEGSSHTALTKVEKLTVGEVLDVEGELLLGEQVTGWVVFALPDGASAEQLHFRWDNTKTVNTHRGWRL